MAPKDYKGRLHTCKLDYGLKILLTYLLASLISRF